MFCSNCGKEIVAGTKFCTGCGAPVLASAGQADWSASVDAFRRALREQAEEDEARKRDDAAIAIAKNEIGYYRQELERVNKTLWVSPLVGFIASATTIPSVFVSNNQAMTERMMDAGMVSDTQILLYTALCAFLFTIVAFGLAFVKEKMSASGYSVFGGWVVLLALFFIVLLVASCVGLPYALTLLGRRSRLKKDIQSATERLKALENRRAAFDGRSSHPAYA